MAPSAPTAAGQRRQLRRSFPYRRRWLPRAAKPRLRRSLCPSAGACGWKTVRRPAPLLSRLPTCLHTTTAASESAAVRARAALAAGTHNLQREQQTSAWDACRWRCWRLPCRAGPAGAQPSDSLPPAQPQRPARVAFKQADRHCGRHTHERTDISTDISCSTLHALESALARLAEEKGGRAAHRYQGQERRVFCLRHVRQFPACKRAIVRSCGPSG